MKKIIALIFVLLIVLTGCSSNKETTSNVVKETQVFSEPDGELTCPRGIVNDAYPGRCGIYVDSNHDGQCDHGQ